MLALSVVMFLAGLCLLATSTQVLLRAWPAQRLGPLQRLPHPGRYYALLGAGVLLMAVGESGLQRRWGWWTFVVWLALVFGVVWVPVIRHNRALTRSTGPQ